LVFKTLVLAAASWATETLSAFVSSHHLSKHRNINNQYDINSNNPPLQPTTGVVGAMINPTATAATTPNNAQKVKTVVGASDERKRFLAHEEFLIYIITNATHHNAAGAPRACLVL